MKESLTNKLYSSFAQQNPLLHTNFHISCTYIYIYSSKMHDDDDEQRAMSSLGLVTEGPLVKEKALRRQACRKEQRESGEH